jgi:hypothetical protein
MAPQTDAAQLHHQPTPSSVAQAVSRARSDIADALARARMLDDQDKPECAQALDDADMMLARR